ncbi:COX assembly mitochondrial protein homolog isoform X1 [Equus quagga]|uniref:COX assembly mitochondrial protein n=1 Tax=Equus asinus TaxID=9793 RepID=A0A9L0JAD8_EQUAS|nr:COX assembly mitochondrial protein homolog isoform X1 [Equus asinus]XP_046521729.1 COX assembly mitochondrial protein homolog isoform X1 [Equus quagga]
MALDPAEIPGHFGCLRTLTLLLFRALWEFEEQHLRHVEKDVLIPKIMREKARERCFEQVQDFTKCCKDSGVLMVVKCRKENSALKECLIAHYNDPAFYEECKMEYLKEREEFRKTGIPTKKRLQKLPTSM